MAAASGGDRKKKVAACFFDSPVGEGGKRRGLGFGIWGMWRENWGWEGDVHLSFPHKKKEALNTIENSYFVSIFEFLML